MSAIAFAGLAIVATVTRAIVTSGQATLVPWRTLALNSAGAFALGLMLVAPWFDDPWILTAAGLGSLTTFSTVGAEISALLSDGHKRHAMAYLGLTLVVGIAAAWLGLSLGETFT